MLQTYMQRRYLLLLGARMACSPGYWCRQTCSPYHRDNPVTQLLVEAGGIGEHHTHVLHGSNLPGRDIPIEAGGIVEHTVHVLHVLHLPMADVLVGVGPPAAG